MKPPSLPLSNLSPQHLGEEDCLSPMNDDASEPFLPHNLSSDDLHSYDRSRGASAKPRLCAKITLPFVLSIFGLFLAMAVFLWSPAQKHSKNNDLLFALASKSSPLLAYKGDITAGVVQKRIHSHNDYEQSYPLLNALSHGASSVEADIWLVNNELLVGHKESDLTPSRTLASLYLDPIENMLLERNRGFSKSKGDQPNSVFQLSPQIPLQLLIDIKTDGPSTFTRLYEELHHLRSMGFLTTYHEGSTEIKPAALTVIGTGNTPLASVQALGNLTYPRDIFLDAPLDILPSKTRQEYNYTVSPLASVDFGAAVGWAWMIPSIGRRRIKRLVDSAHEKSIQARFWNTPNAPPWARSFVWQMLLDQGADWLNADDLPAAYHF